MSENLVNNILRQNIYPISEMFIKEAKNKKLDLNEFILLIYFNMWPKLDLEDIKTRFLMDEKEILDTFASLSTKKIIEIKMIKNEHGKLEESIVMDSFYKNILMEEAVKEKETKEINIFKIFESEFGRTLSPMEYEIINAWLKTNISEELILEALKEATFNGVSNLRYIDKIIYEWGKKGYKTKNDIQTGMKKKTDDKLELFDYDWLNDSEE